MEPQIRYARTSDGVSIACYAVGTGRALLWTQFPFSHLQAELRDPDMVRAYEAIAGVGTLVRYDPRGFGLSDRGITSFTLGELVLDIEAVIDRLEIESFVFLAGGASSPTALRYTSMHPDRVSHLILFPGFARPEGAGWAQWDALASSAVDDWDYVSEALPRAAFGWDDHESLRRDAELIRAAVAPQTLVRYLTDARAWDASDCVQSVHTPTLLIQQMDARYTTMDAARRLAAELPDGRIVMLTGTTTAERQAETFAAAAEFIGGRESTEAARRVRPGAAPGESQPLTVPPRTRVPEPVTSRIDAPPGDPRSTHATAIILFADVVDSTAIAGQIGNAAFRKRTRQLEGALRELIREGGGAPVEGRTLGDGVIGVFTSAAQAIETALQCRQPADNAELRLHLGIHAGDVIHESGNISGVAVSIAARISDLTGPNEILVSGTVRDLARASTRVAFEDRGEHQLKGVPEPQRVFAVHPESG